MDSLEKLKMTSTNIVDNNIEKIAVLFPEVMTEDTDEHGKLRKAINFEKLKDILSEELSKGKETYEFTWVGKRDTVAEAGRPINKTLRPEVDESVNFDTTENVYIEGDNLEALKLLQESYLGKVKMIYIDPPYNTGKDFVYKDKFASSQAELDENLEAIGDDENRLVENKDTDAKYHSNWLNMIYPRLKLARNLLSEDGVIICAIGGNEVSNLFTVMGEIFGLENHIATVIWQGGRKNDSRYVSVGHDYMIIFAKSEVKLAEMGIRWREPKESVDLIISAGKKAWTDSNGNIDIAQKLFKDWWKSLPKNHPAQASKHYSRIEDSTGCPGRVFFPADLSWPGGGGPNYPVLHPKTGRPVKTPTRGWSLQEPRMLEEIAKGRIFFGEDESKVPTYKRYLDETDSQVVDSVFYKDRRAANKEMQALMGKGSFDFPKDVSVLFKWIKLVTNGETEAIILDFFSGSATTAHAVMQLNAEDGGNRKFIMVQLPELTDEKSEAYKAGYKNICEIGKERIRRAGKKIIEENPDVADTLDIGFKVFTVDSSNMKDIYYKPHEIGQLNLLDAVENIKEDRTPLDLLYQVMLSLGLELSLSVSCEDMNGHEVYHVDEDALIACFDSKITEDTFREIAKKQPLRAVFREHSFSNSSSKINLNEIFKELSPHTNVKVI